MYKTTLEQTANIDLSEVSAGAMNWLVWTKRKKARASKLCNPGYGIADYLPWRILEGLPEGLVVSDSDRRVVFANKSARHMLGLTSIVESTQILLPEQGAVTVNVDGEKKTLDVSSKMIRHNGRPLRVSTLRDTTVLFRQLEELSHQCFTDELTGLYNRRGFLTIAQHQIESARRRRRRMIVVFADMDGLKEINDTLGHAAGDAAIRDVAEILKSSLRGGDVVARIGGDEFVVLTSIEDSGDADALIERLKRDVELFNQESLKNYTVRISFGFSVVEPDAHLDLAEVIQRADMEMYREKQRRCNRLDFNRLKDITVP